MPVDDSGVVDSFVVVEWAGQKLNTRLYKNSLDPRYDENLYFLIKYTLSSESILVFHVLHSVSPPPIPPQVL